MLEMCTFMNIKFLLLLESLLLPNYDSSSSYFEHFFKFSSKTIGKKKINKRRKDLITITQAENKQTDVVSLTPYVLNKFRLSKFNQVFAFCKCTKCSNMICHKLCVKKSFSSFNLDDFG